MIHAPHHHYNTRILKGAQQQQQEKVQVQQWQGTRMKATQN